MFIVTNQGKSNLFLRVLLTEGVKETFLPWFLVWELLCS